MSTDPHHRRQKRSNHTVHPPARDPSTRRLHAFGGYGIEVEFMIVDHQTLSVQPIADKLLASGAGQAEADQVQRGAYGWSNELMRHLIEIKNIGPSAGLESVAVGLRRQVDEVNGLLATFGARLMPGAMHPWMDPAAEARLWDGSNDALYQAYHRIFDCRSHGWANLQSMQLNLPFADDGELARLHAAVRLVLPILPALAASSPIAEGRVQREMDHRMVCYLEHQQRVPSLVGSLIPDPITSRADYQAQVQEPMYQDMAALDPEGLLRHEWLDSRGAVPRFDRHAIEIRVIDTQECPEADVAIATFTAAVIRALYEHRWSSSVEQTALDTESLRRVFLDCLRDADRAVIGNTPLLRQFGYPGHHCLAADLWRHLFLACAEDPLLTPVQAAWVIHILEQGPLARRLLNVLGTQPSPAALKEVYGNLCDCLAAGTPFSGDAS